MERLGEAPSGVSRSSMSGRLRHEDSRTLVGTMECDLSLEAGAGMRSTSVLARHVDRLRSARPCVAEVERDELSRSEELVVSEPALGRAVDRRLDDESVVSAVVAYDSAHDATALAHAAARAHHEHDVDHAATRHG
jgi:hypothetical protein